MKAIDDIPEALKLKHKTVFGIDHEYIIDAAARRQKWIDQSQSVNLFLATPDMKTLSHMYRRAWTSGLKTTYYLRTLRASNIEKATVAVKKEVRGVAGGKREFTSEEKMACSIEAMRSEAASAKPASRNELTPTIARVEMPKAEAASPCQGHEA